MKPYLENQNKHIFLTHKKESYDFPAHFHKSIEMCCCLEGKQKIKLGENLYTLEKNDILVIFPGCVHEYIKCEGFENQSESVCIISQNLLISHIFPEIITKSPKNPHIKAKDVPENALLSFLKIIDAKSDAERVGWTHIALSSIIDLIDVQDTKSDVEVHEKIVKYIDDNFTQDLTVEYISKIFGYHPSYISHLFCDRLKIPFRTYLGAVRCESAAKDIRQNKKSLTEIAFDNGFNSLNTFCRCFKKHFSCTPSEYKKSNM